MNGQKILIPVIGDGSCLFRCLSYFIFSTQECHYIIRLIIVKFITDRWNNFKEFICGEGVYDIQISNEEDYYNHLSKQQIYGGQVEIAAFLHIFPNIKIVIHQDNRPPVIHGNTMSNFQLILKLSGIVDSGHYDIIQCYNENYKVENIENLKNSALDTKKHFDADKKIKYHKEYMRKYRMKSNQPEQNIQSNVKANKINKTGITKTKMSCLTKPSNNDQLQQDIQDININNKETEDINDVNNQNLQQFVQEYNERMIDPETEEMNTNKTPRKRKKIYMREYMRKKRAEQKKKRDIKKLNFIDNTENRSCVNNTQIQGENGHLNQIYHNNLNQSVNVEDLHHEISNDKNEIEEQNENDQTGINDENILENTILIHTKNNKYSNYNDHISAHKYFDKEFCTLIDSFRIT